MDFSDCQRSGLEVTQVRIIGNQLGHAFRSALVLLALGLPLVVVGETKIYKWTDAHGHVHYSDRAAQKESSEHMELETVNIMHSQRDEFWNFEFDGREWELGHQQAAEYNAIREYVLAGQSVKDWTELVTSLYLKTSLSVQQYYEKFWIHDPNCPSLTTSKIYETADTIIFEGKHGACGGYDPGEFVQRCSGIDGGILSLVFAQKGQLTSENRSSWTKALREANTKNVRSKVNVKMQSLPLHQLGSLPENTVSEYLETLGTGSTTKTRDIPISGQFTIQLQVRKSLPAGTYLEAHFPDPSNFANKDIESKVLTAGETEVLFISPSHTDIKCWNYEILIYIYRDKSKVELLGTHRQYNQSRINYERIKDSMDYISASKAGGRCP